MHQIKNVSSQVSPQAEVQVKKAKQNEAPSDDVSLQ